MKCPSEKKPFLSVKKAKHLPLVEQNGASFKPISRSGTRPPSRRLGYSSHRRLGYSFTPPLQSLSPPLHHAAWVPCLAPCVEGSTYPLLWSLFIHNSHVNMFAGGGARIRVCQGFGEGLLGLFFAVLGSSGLSWWLCWVFFVFGLKIEI